VICIDVHSNDPAGHEQPDDIADIELVTELTVNVDRLCKSDNIPTLFLVALYPSALNTCPVI
jgi:hypothetical protein